MVQLRPAVLPHATLRQARPAPQETSSGALLELQLPLALQVITVQLAGSGEPQEAPCAPVAYLHLPSAGSQAPGPSWQSGGEAQALAVPPTHRPDGQVRPVMQAFPSEQGLPLQAESAQSTSPLQSSSRPSLQLVSLSAQAWHAPAAQVVPAGQEAPTHRVSEQRALTQAWPAGHFCVGQSLGRHWPAAHTWLAAQLTPTQAGSMQVLVAASQTWRESQVAAPQVGSWQRPCMHCWPLGHLTPAQAGVTQASSTHHSPDRQAAPVQVESRHEPARHSCRLLQTSVSQPQVVSPMPQATQLPAEHDLPLGHEAPTQRASAQRPLSQTIPAGQGAAAPLQVVA